MQSRKVKLNIVLSVLLTLSLLFASVPGHQANAAVVVRDQESAILLAADHLVELQNSDGGFGWKLPLPDEPISYTNVLGITSLGILKANEFQNKDTYETALAGAYDYAAEKSPVYTWNGDKFTESTNGVDSSPDITFLVWLAQAAAGDATLLAAVNNLQDPDITIEDIAALAKTRWDSKILYFGSTSETDPDGTAASMAQRLLDERFSQGYPAMGIWDVELSVKAALALDSYFPAQGYAQQADDMTEVLYAAVDNGSYFSSTDSSQTDYLLGLTGAIEAFAETGLHLDKAAELKTILLDLQQADGSWNFYGAVPVNQSVQSTAYALMALNSLGGVAEMTPARKGADWLVKNQNTDGGWYAEGGAGDEYLEMDSEAAWALAVVPAAVTIGNLGYYSIQSAIDSASAGDTINVFPGAYDETASGRYLFNATGPYQFGLFLGEGKDGITLQGVDALGTPVTDYNNVQASVITNATNSFGTSGVFVETNNITITGLEFLNNTAGDNKTIEVIGDNFTLKYSVFSIPEQGGSVYLNDWRYDDVTPDSYVESYTIEGNYFKYNTSVDISSGAGFTGDPANRKIINNVFDAQYSTGEVGEWATVSFNGYCPSVGWFVDPVGGAVITGNSFGNGVQYIRTRCIPDTTGFDWESYWNDNTFDKKVIAGSNPPGTVTPYSYSSFEDVRRIGTSIQFGIDNAAASDTVLVGAGTYAEDLEFGKSLLLMGPNALVSPNGGARNPEAVISPIDEGLSIPDAAVKITAPDISVAIQGFNLDMINGGQGDRFVDMIGKQNVTLDFQKNIFTGAEYSVNGNWYISGDTTGFDLTVNDNFFTGNATSNGIALFSPTVHSITITNNTWEDNQGWAMNFNNVHGVISNNTFLDKVDNGPEWSDDQVGIIFASANNDVTMSNNLFDGIVSPAINLYETFGGVLAADHNIFKNIQGDLAAVRVRDVTADISNVTLSCNQFENNSLDISNPTMTPFAASPNWWGSISGPDVAKLIGEVVYQPWAGDAACTWFMPLTANDQSVTTAYITPVEITLTTSDVGGNTLDWIVVDQPAHGTLTGTGPTLTYTPDPGFSGSDSFTFKTSLETVESNTATVSITVAEQTEWILYFPLIFNN